MTEQTKLLLLGAGTAAISKFYLHKDTKTALLWGAGVIVALVVYDSVVNKATATT
jgi:hypothetical protein